jgi:hypothetical protein
VSRGPGVWQRGILAAVEQHEAIYLIDLLPRDPSDAMYQAAVYRAAHTLARAGRIDLWQGGLSHSPLIVARLGTPWPAARDTKRLVRPAADATQHIYGDGT